ncbi:MAG: glycosyltransferase family 92 protein, partial [Deltaproteobacteria bacterium]
MFAITKFWRQSTRLIGIQPPKPDPSRHGIALGSVVRNEARHIAEWLRFHEFAGVRAFYLYDDGSTDDTLAIARASVRDASLTIFPWHQRIGDARTGLGLHTQALAFAHCISNFGGAFRWMAMIDPDEFLVPVQHTSLNDALATIDKPQISLPWVMFGRNGHETPPEGGTLRNYLHRARDLRLNSAPGVYNTKAIFDPCRITAVHVHRMRSDHTLTTWNDRGDAYATFNAPRPAKQSNALIQLNHYVTRSDAELQEKLAKGGTFTDRKAHRPDIIMRRVAAI